MPGSRRGACASWKRLRRGAITRPSSTRPLSSPARPTLPPRGGLSPSCAAPSRRASWPATASPQLIRGHQLLSDQQDRSIRLHPPRYATLESTQTSSSPCTSALLLRSFGPSSIALAPQVCSTLLLFGYGCAALCPYWLADVLRTLAVVRFYTLRKTEGGCPVRSLASLALA